MRLGLIVGAIIWGVIGCTAIYVSGDNNSIKPAKTIDLKNKNEQEKKNATDK